MPTIPTHKRIVFLFPFIPFILLVLLAHSASGADEWSITSVDSSAANSPSMTTDSSDNYLISYGSNSGSTVYFAKSTDKGDTWATSTISATAGVVSSISTDQADNYLVASTHSYLSFDPFECFITPCIITKLYFSKSINGGSTWSTAELLSNEGTKYMNPVITVDQKGYYLISAGQLQFSKSVDGGSNWSTSNIDGTALFESPSITVDASNNYLVSYHDQNSLILKFAKSTNDGSNWSATTVDSDGSVGNYSSITTDASNNYLISYMDFTNKDVKFAKSTDGGSNWSTTTVYSDGNVGWDTSIITDASSNYLITYYDNDTNVLKLSKSTDGGNTWATSTVSTQATASHLTTDSTDSYLISYRDTSDAGLDFARLNNDPPNLVLTPISPDPTSTVSPVLSGSVEDNLGSVTSVEFQVDSISGSWSNCIADDGTFDESSETFSCTISSALSEGAHRIYVRATDSGGNTTSSGSEAFDKFVVDTSPPGFPVDSAGAVVNIVPGTSVTVDTPRPEFVGITEPNAHVVITIYSDPIVGETDADENGNWNWTPDKDIPNGSHRVVVSVTDLAGNEASYELTLSVGLEDTGVSIFLPMTTGVTFLAVGSRILKKKYP